MSPVALAGRPYLTTLTGRQIGPDFGVPSLVDIAVGLSRAARFAGQGKTFFSVLVHSLWMDDLYQHLFKGCVLPEVRLALLLHDAHEGVMSDIPSPLKMLEQKHVQYALDERIFNTYFAQHGGYLGYTDREAAPYQTVKDLDWRALLTEYWSIGPAHECYLDKPSPEDARFFETWRRENGPKPSPICRRHTLAGLTDPPSLAWTAEKHPAVREFLNRVIRLM